MPYDTVQKVKDALPTLGLGTGSKEIVNILSDLYDGLTPVRVSKTQTITAAAAIDLDATYVSITGPASSTYAVTLAAPTKTGIVKVIEMVATTSTNAVTLALTNVAGGSAATTATFNAAAETLVLVSAGTKWVVLKESGVTLA